MDQHLIAMFFNVPQIWELRVLPSCGDSSVTSISLAVCMTPTVVVSLFLEGKVGARSMEARQAIS